MKDIRSYLHLYIDIDCQFKERKTGRMFTRTLEPSDIDRYFQEDYYSYIKPILRPIDDIVDDSIEDKWLHDYCFGKGIAPSFPEMAEITAYFLEHGFDLFGLIDSDLAIDKTKL